MNALVKLYVYSVFQFNLGLYRQRDTAYSLAYLPLAYIRLPNFHRRRQINVVIIKYSLFVMSLKFGVVVVTTLYKLIHSMHNVIRGTAHQTVSTFDLLQRCLFEKKGEVYTHT